MMKNEMPLPNTPLASLPIVVFDTETTGLFTMSAWMVEIAGVRMTGSMISTGVFQTLVRPDAIIPPDATKVHGITDDEVRDAPPTVDVLRAFFDWATTGTALKENGEPFRTIDDIIDDLGFIPEEEDDSNAITISSVILGDKHGRDYERPPHFDADINSIPASTLKTNAKQTETKSQEFEPEAAKPVIFAAHNAPYDMGILSTAFRRSGQKPPAEFVCIDTCAWARKAMKLNGYSLESIVDYIADRDDIEIPFIDIVGDDCLGIDAAMFAMQGFHRALCDAFHTAVVLSHLMQVTGIERSNATLADLNERYPGVVSVGIADHSANVELPPHLSKLTEAIESGADVRIKYNSESGITHPRKIKPLGVYGLKASAYLEAFCYIDGFVKTFRVDKIREVL